jgi:hypothetical protein
MLWPLSRIRRAVCGLGSMAALAGAGCGGRPAAPPPAQPLEIATPRPETENAAAPLAAHAPGAPDFAPSSLTAFANQVTVVVGEVLDGRQPSRSPLPLAPSRDSEPLLKQEPAKNRRRNGPFSPLGTRGNGSCDESPL